METHLFAAADRSAVTKMQDFCTTRFIKAYLALFKDMNEDALSGELNAFSQVIIDITRTIYAITPASQKKLRDFVIRTIPRNIEQFDILTRRHRLKQVSALIADEPDLAYDLATRSLSTALWICKQCERKPGAVVVTFCDHGNWDCTDEKCDKATISGNYCSQCARLGTFQRWRAHANNEN